MYIYICNTYITDILNVIPRHFLTDSFPPPLWRSCTSGLNSGPEERGLGAGHGRTMGRPWMVRMWLGPWMATS